MLMIACSVAAGGYQPGTKLPRFEEVQLILQNSSSTCNLTIGGLCSRNPDGTCTMARSFFSNAPSNRVETDGDCRLPSATAVGFRTLKDNLTLCIGPVRRIKSSLAGELCSAYSYNHVCKDSACLHLCVALLVLAPVAVCSRDARKQLCAANVPKGLLAWFIRCRKVSQQNTT